MSHDYPPRFFEDFAVGDVYSHRASRVATETDRVWFAALTMNQHAMHVAGGESRGIVPVTWTLSVVVGLSVEDISWNATTNLAWADAAFPAPVCVGDTIRASTEVLAVDDASDALTVKTTGTNQEHETVAVLTRKIAIRRRPSSTGKEIQ